MALSQRLLTIASLVDRDAIAIDIGSDHGHIPRYLLQSGQVKKMYATEFGPSTFLQLKTNLADTDVMTYQADGLINLPADITCVIITGMGGGLIASMLQAKASKHQSTLVLGPQRDVHVVRKTLQIIGYRITEERLIEEHQHYYQLIKAQPGAMNLNNFDAYYGPLLHQACSPLWLNMLKKEKVNLLKKVKIKDNEIVKNLLEGIANYVKD
jgi:tRNA (adenine22-N1)-methyltransferase